MSPRQPRTAATSPKDVLAANVNTPAAPARTQPVAAKAVGSFVPRLTRQAFAKFGFSTATLLTEWPAIVGADLAQWTAPERVRWPKSPQAGPEADTGQDQARPGATLVLRVNPGRALDIQYRGRQILERINAYFGYRAIADLRLVQAPLRAPRPRPVTDQTQLTPAKLPPALNTVADSGLRAALEQMAAGVAARAAERDRRR